MASPASSTEQQRAAKRKSHRKSRNGCFQCKQRHSKCNETHPRCSNCVRLDIECTWPSRERFSTTYPTPPESYGTVIVERCISDPDVQHDTFGSDMSLADLRLLHHWMAKTCHDMSPDPARQNAWQNGQTEMALDFPFLLRGILAVSAMHKVLTDPEADRSGLLTQADAHISRALGTYRQNLEQPRPETAVPMFLLSAVLVVYNLGAAQLESPSDPMHAMAQCIRMIQGVKIVAEPNWEKVTNSQVFKDLAHQKILPVAVEPVKEVLRLKKLTETKKTAAADVYIQAIDDLNAAFLRTRDCTPGEDMLPVAWGWTSCLTEPFTHLIEAHDPVAVLILAYFAVLIDECWASWWFRDFPQKILLAAQKLLMSTPELLDYLDWPSQKLNDKSRGIVAS